MNISQFNFGAGEINPRMENRLDTDVAKIGLYKAENVIITPQGSAIRRPGLEYKKDVSQGTISGGSARGQGGWIIPMIVQGEDFIVLTRDDRWIQLYKVASNGDLTEVATFDGSVGSAWLAPSILQYATVAQGTDEIFIIGFNQGSGAAFTPRRLSVTFSDPTYTIAIEQPFTATFSTSGKPTNADTVWNLWKSSNGGQYAATVWRGRLWISGQRSRPSALGGSQIVGTGYKYSEDGTNTTYTDVTTNPTDQTRGFKDWDATAWIPIYGSYKGVTSPDSKFMRIREGVSEINAVDYYLGNSVGKTMWLIGQKVLYQGTDTMELVFQESADGRTNPDPVTQPMVKYDSHSQVGSTSHIAVMTADGPLHINGDQVRMIVYSTEKQAYNSVPMSDHSNLRGPFVQAVATTVPYPIVWYITASGELWSFTLEQKNGVAAWCKHTTWNQDGTQAKVKSGASIRMGTEQIVYFLVERKVNGATKRFIEKLRPFTYDDQMDAAYLDSMVSGATTLNMSHLTGGEVSVMVDGATDNPVQAGASIEWTTATKVHAGIAYPSVMVTTKRRVDVQGQQVDDRRIKVSKAMIMVEKTLGLRVGPDSLGTDLEQGFTWDDETDTAPEWYSGELSGYLNGPQGAERIRIESTGPLPFEVLGITVSANAG